MVNMSETVSQTSEMKVRLLTDADIRSYNLQYLTTEGVDPPADEALAKEQLTSLFALVNQCNTISVDFALWVPHWSRLCKVRRFRGVIMNEWGQLIYAEVLGPANFPLWESSCICFGPGPSPSSSSPRDASGSTVFISRA